MKDVDRYALTVLLAGVLFAAAAGAQPVRELGLEESVQLGLQQYPELEATAAEAEAAEAARDRANAARLPTLAGTARYTRVGGGVSDIAIPIPELEDVTAFEIPRNQVYTEARIEQLLFSAPRRHRIQAAEHRARAARRSEDLSQADVAFAVRRAYWDLYRATALRDSLEVAISRVEGHETEVRALVEAGAAVPSDLLQAQTRTAEVRLEVVEAQNAVRVGELELGQLLGLPPGARVRPTTEIEIEPGEAAIPAAPAAEPPDIDPLSGHPELAALREQARALESETDAADLTWLPEVSLFGRAIYARPNPNVFVDQTQFRGSYELGAALDWTIWRGGARRDEAREARAQLAAARARLEGARRELAVERMRSLLELQRAAEAAQVAAENVEAASESLRVTMALFQEGATLSAAVLDAEAALRDAQAGLANARADFAIARAALVHARGDVR